jgi:hypothetical protein
LPLHSRTPEVEAYVVLRLRMCRSASRARFVRASLRIFVEADERGLFRRRVGIVPRPVPTWLARPFRSTPAFFASTAGRPRGRLPNTCGSARASPSVSSKRA